VETFVLAAQPKYNHHSHLLWCKLGEIYTGIYYGDRTVTYM